MILAKNDPFTKEEIENLKYYKTYIKTVIDIEKKVCCAGARMHFEEEKLLLEQGSSSAAFGVGGDRSWHPYNR